MGGMGANFCGCTGTKYFVLSFVVKNTIYTQCSSFQILPYIGTLKLTSFGGASISGFAITLVNDAVNTERLGCCRGGSNRRYG